MSARRPASAAQRTRFAIAGVAAAASLLVSALLWTAWLTFTVDARTDQLSRQVLAIAGGLEAAPGAEPLGPLTGLRARFFEVEAALMDARLLVTDDSGIVVHSSATDDTLTSVEIQTLTDDPDERGVRSGVRPLGSTGSMIIVVAPLTGGYLVGAQPVRALAEVQRTGLLAIAGSALAALIAAWVVGGLVARRMTGPLVRLTEGAEAITGGLWGHQVELEGDAEVTALARAFNEMSERASAAYRAQKEFVGDVSHELRTPVTSILGFSQALLDGTADDDESRERFARIVHAEAERLLELTTTLLALADLDSGRVELAREAVSTTRLFEALEARHSAAATSRGVSLDLEDSSAGVAPLADEARVLQVATALISNALAHTPERGRLRVSARGEGDHWCFAVDDSGAGVAAEDHARIFERFVRLDRSRSQQTGGSGLGLAICSRLVTMMDGTIGVTDSDLGGARFYVCLPRADSPGELNTNSTPAQLADNADGR